jgi:hypothetical protein
VIAGVEEQRGDVGVTGGEEVARGESVAADFVEGESAEGVALAHGLRTFADGALEGTAVVQHAADVESDTGVVRRCCLRIAIGGEGLGIVTSDAKAVASFVLLEGAGLAGNRDQCHEANDGRQPEAMIGPWAAQTSTAGRPRAAGDEGLNEQQSQGDGRKGWEPFDWNTVAAAAEDGRLQRGEIVNEPAQQAGAAQLNQAAVADARDGVQCLEIGVRDDGIAGAAVDCGNKARPSGLRTGIVVPVSPLTVAVKMRQPSAAASSPSLIRRTILAAAALEVRTRWAASTSNGPAEAPVVRPKPTPGRRRWNPPKNGVRAGNSSLSHAVPRGGHEIQGERRRDRVFVLHRRAAPLRRCGGTGRMRP